MRTDVYFEQLRAFDHEIFGLYMQCKKNSKSDNDAFHVLEQVNKAKQQKAAFIERHKGTKK